MIIFSWAKSSTWAEGKSHSLWNKNRMLFFLNLTATEAVLLVQETDIAHCLISTACN